MSWKICWRKERERERRKDVKDESREVGQGQIIKGVCVGFRIWNQFQCFGELVKVFMFQFVQIFFNVQIYYILELKGSKMDL